MKNEKGFVLVGLLIAVVIIAILVVIYYKGSGNGEKSQGEVGKEAIEETKRNNQLQLEQQIEIQNQINSIQ